MKYITIAAPIGTISATERFFYHPQYVAVQNQNSASSSSSSSSSSSDDESNMMVRGDDGSGYPAAMSGFGGYHTYIRDTPDRFESEADDTLMRSMYYTYATEGKKDGLPTGHFWVTKEDGKKAATEVVNTHLKLKGDKLKAYVEENFPTYWKKYDVNDDNKIEVDRMPVFLKSICGNSEACYGL